MTLQTTPNLTSRFGAGTGPRILVVYTEDHRNLTSVLTHLLGHGCDASLALPLWGRPNRLPPVRVVDLKKIADRPEPTLNGVDMVVLPSIPAALLLRLLAADESGPLVKFISAARRVGRPLVALAHPSQITILRSLGIAAIPMEDLTRPEGLLLDLPECGSCATWSSCATKCLGKVQDLAAAGASRLGGGAGGPVASRALARLIDHTLLKADATEAELRALCAEARQHHFKSVCVNPTWVAFAADQLANCPVVVCTVIGFPLGASDTQTKAYEAGKAIENGAAEVDMVVNIGALKSKDYQRVEEDIRAVVEAARKSRKSVIVKVILETALLTDEEKVVACALSSAAGADFVKTSTGFSTGGATARDVALMRATVGPRLGVKASGGVRDTKTAENLIEAGATRIGASASVAIVSGAAAGSSAY